MNPKWAGSPRQKIFMKGFDDEKGVGNVKFMENKHEKM